ncbi:MAG: heavy metal translocating P-type ATPase [Oscillospiraceae bacterium]|nr:heavy metal translocating P-type ATPase [Oscillospiraceae bacterium]
MKFQIVYDKPGRIRFRCGSYAFEKSLEIAIVKLISSNGFVTHSEAHSENGSILVYYKKGYRDAVIHVVAEIQPKKLTPAVPDSDIQIAEINRRFKNSLIKFTVKRTLSKILIPAPLHCMITTVRGMKYILNGLQALLECKLNVDVLDAASVAACLAQKNYKTAGSIMFLLSISSLLEDYTKARTRAALTDSLAVKIDKVWLINGETEILIPISDLKVGNCIRVRTGSMIPVDGEIIDGEAYVNESSMTGEPLAVMKSSGDTVFAGTVVEEGIISICVRELSSNTKISKIIDLIENSEQLKAGVQSRAEHLADSIVPFSFLGFGLTLLLTRNVTKAISLLMVDYSCAIKLSTPIAVISAIREAADHNITVKGGKYLEEFAHADTVVFDKTGTLTKAEPVLEKVIPFDTYTADEVLRIAACLEEHFPHSVARAIVKGAADKGLDHEEEHADVQYIVAHGIATEFHGKRAVIGSRHFVSDDENVKITVEQQAEIDEKSGACSVIYLAIGGKLAGVLCISDPPRAEAKTAIDLLKKAGIHHIVMLTGDSQKAAVITAARLGITEYHAQVLPEDKHRMVEEIKSQGHRTIMVGDGINDAPALAVANVSVAMNDASDIAREVADITLKGSDLTELAVFRELSKRLMNRINCNYRFIVGFNSALLLSGLFGILTPSLSALLHNASTMAICAKSMLPLLNEDEEKI